MRLRRLVGRPRHVRLLPGPCGRHARALSRRGGTLTRGRSLVLERLFVPRREIVIRSSRSCRRRLIHPWGCIGTQRATLLIVYASPTRHGGLLVIGAETATVGKPKTADMHPGPDFASARTGNVQTPPPLRAWQRSRPRDLRPAEPALHMMPADPQPDGRAPHPLRPGRHGEELPGRQPDGPQEPRHRQAGRRHRRRRQPLAAHRGARRPRLEEGAPPRCRGLRRRRRDPRPARDQARSATSRCSRGT